MKGGISLEKALNIFLSDYRSIEHCSTGRSPAYLMYKREIRTRLDLLKPSLDLQVEKSQRAQIINKAGKRHVNINKGDDVLIDNFAARSERRIQGKIVKQLTPSSFLVRDETGQLQKRHVDQIVKCATSATVQKESPEYCTENFVPRRSPRLRNK